MLRQIIELLQSEDFYAVSDTIEIAKGKNKIPQTIAEGKTQIKRQWQLRK